MANVALGSVVCLDVAMALFLFWWCVTGSARCISRGFRLFCLALFLGLIAVTGIMAEILAARQHGRRKGFHRGADDLHPVEPPRHPLFLLHLFFVLDLTDVVLPVRKLTSCGGIFFDPSRQPTISMSRCVASDRSTHLIVNERLLSRRYMAKVRRNTDHQRCRQKWQCFAAHIA